MNQENKIPKAVPQQGLIVQTDLSAGKSVGEHVKGWVDKATDPETWRGLTANWDPRNWKLS